MAHELGLHHELIPIDQIRLHEHQRKLAPSYEQSGSGLLLEPLDDAASFPRTNSAFQSTRSSVLDTTYCLATSIVRAKGFIHSGIQSGRTPVLSAGRHACSIIR